MAKIIVDGLETEVEGVLPTPGGVAPILNLTDEELKEVSLETYAGKKKVLNIFPSVDTPTCATSVRKFNAAASKYPDTVVLCISADLPFAQSRFCGAAGLDNVISLSTFRHPEFLRNWGVLLATGELQGLAARAVVVLDEQDEVCYSELVTDLSAEPDYEAALAAL